MRQAQDSGAVNLNPMIEALPVHSQLWLICEHCPGGSVKTLMRATNDRLSEKYIVIVARELAKALKGLHAAGIIHRDIKAANVLIHEEGNLQLCDFGVANVLDNRTDKRRTFIGTLHWMPPELWTERPEYSDEVDVWEYGCTLYECALGRPPNSDLRERQQLKMRMRRLKQAIALPESENFSEGFRDLVKFTLSPEASTRPSMKDVLEHNYLSETEETHPTKDLSELVQNYYGWLFRGGNRVSLFMPGGAPAAATEGPDTEIGDSDDWNFSTTQNFEKRISSILEIPDLSDLSTEFEEEDTPRGAKATQLSPPRHMSAAQKANFEARVNRGAADLSNLFDQSAPAYEFKAKTDFVPVSEQPPLSERRTSDLPFRAMAEDRPTSIASVVFDLGDFDEADFAPPAPRTDENIQTTYVDTPKQGQAIKLADAATLRQKRADSKGPRDSSNQDLTARRASSADDIHRQTMGIAAHDFAAAQKTWSNDSNDKPKPPELQEAAEITPNNPARATMAWSFADAMADMGSTITNERPSSVTYTANETTPTNNNAHANNAATTVGSDEPGPEEEEDLPSVAASRSQSQTRARATLDWSFDSAMLELNENGASTKEDSENTPLPQPTAQRMTPPRPTNLTRQMTMPVTAQDFITAEDNDDLPYRRPATAMSDAISITSSTSSADIDPFGLDNTGLDEMPGPGTLDADSASRGGIGGFYATRGRTILPDMPWPTDILPPEAGNRPYALTGGRPTRIGDDNFPGPPAAMIPPGARLNNNHVMTNNNSISNHSASHSRGSTGSTGSGSGSGTNSRPVLEFP